MSTYRNMAYAIQTHLKQNFDDTDISVSLIVYWIKLVANRLKYQTIKKKETSMFLLEFPKVQVLTNNKDEKYSILPQYVYDLDNDTGIASVFYEKLENCDFPYVKFSRTKTTRKDILYKNPFRKPSTNNPYFYLTSEIIDGKKTLIIKYLGIECIEIESVDLLLYAQEDPNEFCDIDSEIGVAPEQEKLIYYEVYNLSRYGYVTASDKQNDGKDTSANQKETQYLLQPVKTVYQDINDSLIPEQQQQ